MTDDDVLTAVRDCLTTARDRVAGEEMTRPVGAIINRARRRRMYQGLNAAAAVIVVVAVFTLLPGSGDHGTTQAAKLAAWTVIDKPGGQVNVTIRELRDPGGLQRRLRADGVPATIQFASQFSARHHPCYYPLPPNRAFRLLSRIFPRVTSASGQTAFTINPSAIPARIGLWIHVSPPAGHGPGSAEFSASWTLVYANGRCPSGKVPGIDVGAGAGVVGGGSK
jgi:hypothetical protein